MRPSPQQRTRGNLPRVASDYLTWTGAPTCQSVRESLSALMDREWPALRREQATAHLRAPAGNAGPGRIAPTTSPGGSGWVSRPRPTARRRSSGRLTSAHVLALVDPAAARAGARGLGDRGVVLAGAGLRSGRGGKRTRPMSSAPSTSRWHSLWCSRPPPPAGRRHPAGPRRCRVPARAHRRGRLLRGTTTWSHEAPHALRGRGLPAVAGPCQDRAEPAAPSPRRGRFTVAAPSPGFRSREAASPVRRSALRGRARCPPAVGPERLR